MKAPLVLVLLACAICSGARANAGAARGDEYLQLLASYAAAPAAAIERLARMDHRSVEQGVDECVSRSATGCQWRQLVGAAVLHADAAAATADTEPEIRFHLAMGQRLVSRLRQEVESDEPVPPGFDEAFIGRWYAGMIRLLSAHRYVAAAQRLTVAALAAAPRSPEVYLARGMIAEIGMLWAFSDIRGAMDADGARPLLRRIERGSNADKILERASLDYRRATELDPSYAWAHLRLGWVHAIVHDSRAPRDLESALAAAQSADAKYLAHLLLGGVAERERTADNAVAHYQAARQLLPTAHAACVALSHAHGLTGATQAARDVALECLSLQPQAEDDLDPWILFRYGFLDLASAAWLHGEARQR